MVSGIRGLAKFAKDPCWKPINTHTVGADMQTLQTENSSGYVSLTVNDATYQ